MSHQFTLSKKGLKLIKAFEGFYPVDQILVTGQRVVGYGHRVRDDKAIMVTREQAESLLPTGRKGPHDREYEIRNADH